LAERHTARPNVANVGEDRGSPLHVALGRECELSLLETQHRPLTAGDRRAVVAAEVAGFVAQRQLQRLTWTPTTSELEARFDGAALRWPQVPRRSAAEDCSAP